MSLSLVTEQVFGGNRRASVPVPDVTVALVHEQDIIYFILNVERVQRHRFIQGEGVVSHIGVGQGFLRSKTIHGVKSQDLLQEIQGCRGGKQ